MGERVDGCTLLERLGPGDYGAEFLALDEARGDVCRVEVFSAASVQPATVAALVEARKRSAELQLPGVVPLLGAGREGTHHFVRRGLVEGRRLTKCKVPMRADAAASLIAKVAEVLSPLHERGVAHGWLRPRVIWVATDGGVHLEDAALWIQPREHRRPGDDFPEAVYSLAPDARGGKPIEPVTDVYSLGVLLHYLVVGDYPFQGDSQEEILFKHMFHAPPQPEGFPEALWTVTRTCLRKRTSDRHPTAAGLSRALSSVLSTS